MRIQIVLALVAFAALLFYSGIGVVRLLSFDRIRGGEIVLAAVAGAALLITVGSWTGAGGWSAGVALVVALAIATLLNLVSIVRARGRSLDREATIGGVALAALVIVVGVAPLWMVNRPDTVIGRNGDQVTYTNLATYLTTRERPLDDPPGPLAPAATQRWLVDHYGIPIGFSHVHAMVSRLTGQPAYTTFSMVTAVFLALNALTAIFVGERAFGLARGWALTAGVLIAISPALMWIHYNNYAMQTVAVGLIATSFCVSILAIDSGQLRGLLLAALLVSAVFVTYPPAAGPFLLAPIGIYLVLLTRAVPLGIVAKRGLVLGSLIISLNVPTLIYMSKLFRPMIGYVLVKEFGDVSSHVSPAQVFGFVHHTLSTPFAWALPLGLALTAAGAWLAAYGAVGTTPTGRRAFASLLLTATPFLLWLRWGLDYPYGFYKALMFVVTPLLIGLVLGAQRAIARGPVAVATGSVVVLILAGGASATNLFREARTMPIFDLAPTKALTELARWAPRDEPLHVRDESGTALLWITFFLQHRPLYLEHYSPYYLDRRWAFYQDPITAPLVLVNREARRPAPWDGGTLYANARYRVVRKNPAVLAHLDFSPEPRIFEVDERMRIGFSRHETVIDERRFASAMPAADGRVVALGLWTADAAAVRLLDGAGERAPSIARPQGLVSWPASTGSSEVVVLNRGPHAALLPGWIAIVTPEFRPSSQTTGSLLDSREQILPGSNFFAIRGWHYLEGARRWTRAVGVAAFRAPAQRSSLSIDCALLRPPSMNTPRVTVRVNGQQVGEPTCSGRSPELFPLPEALFGELSWAWLELRVDPVFVPKTMGLSADERDLGVLVQGLKVEPRS